MRPYAILATVLALVATQAHAQIVVRGTVVDASNDSPITDVHVVVSETGRGTISNSQGRFEIVLNPPAILTVRHVGYQSASISITVRSPREITVSLTPSVLALDEIIVAGEALAENVMARVIRQKQEAWSTISAYSARAYVRYTLTPGDATTPEEDMSIRESVFDQYYRRDAGVREVLRSYRETDKGYSLFQLPPFGSVPDFYADDVLIGGRTFVGPTHPDALEAYVFSFAGVRSIDGRPVYDIYLAPRSDRRATLIGTISVLRDEYVMIECSLRPARHVDPAPPRTTWSVHYEQQFRPAIGGPAPDTTASRRWLPVSLVGQGRIATSDGPRDVLTARLEQSVVIGQYRLDDPGPDRWFANDARHHVDSLTVFADHLFTLGDALVALTPRELRAYELARGRLPTTSIRAHFRGAGPSDVLTLLTPRINTPDGPRLAWPNIYGYAPFFRYNRVDGLLSGIGQQFRPSPGSFVSWRLAQSTGWRRVRYELAFRRQVSESVWVGGSLFKDVEPAASFSRYSGSVASLGTVSGRGDYFDYHRVIRKAVSAGLEHGAVRLSGEMRSSRIDSIAAQIGRSWPVGNAVRANPAAAAGHYPEAVLSIAVGAYRDPYAARPPMRVAVTALASPAGLLDSDGFTLANLEASASLPTLSPQSIQRPHLDLFLHGGATRGRSPYAWSADGMTGGFRLFGSMAAAPDRPLAGAAGVAVAWRHDFERAPFDLLRLDRRRVVGASLSIHGGHAIVDVGGGEFRVHHEFGFGVSDLFGLPLEFTLTRRGDHPTWYFGFGVRSRTGTSGRF